jgi:hypothetical protein
MMSIAKFAGLYGTTRWDTRDTPTRAISKHGSIRWRASFGGAGRPHLLHASISTATHFNCNAKC